MRGMPPPRLPVLAPLSGLSTRGGRPCGVPLAAKILLLKTRTGVPGLLGGGVGARLGELCELEAWLPPRIIVFTPARP